MDGEELLKQYKKHLDLAVEVLEYALEKTMGFLKTRFPYELLTHDEQAHLTYNIMRLLLSLAVGGDEL